MRLTARWREFHQLENRPAHRGISAMVGDARGIFEDENEQEKASDAHIRRYVKACGILANELGREPIEEEVQKRVERMRREDHEWNQQKSQVKYSRTAYGTDSGGASSSTDQQGRGHQYGARAGDAEADAREQWGDQSWRGSPWSSSTTGRMHEHDRRHFDTPQHRDPQRYGDTSMSWEATRGAWRERVPEQWQRARAEWNWCMGGWQNFL